MCEPEARVEKYLSIKGKILTVAPTLRAVSLGNLRIGSLPQEGDLKPEKNSAGRTRTYNQPVNSRLLYH